MRKLALGLIFVALAQPHSSALAQSSAGFGMPVGMQIATIHAEGAQVYECRADATGTLAWHFREPVATLIEHGRTIGRHYVGPSWELADGTAVHGKVVAKSPGASAADIPWLKLAAQTTKGTGTIAGTTTILRINTKGGLAKGPCLAAGAFLNVPYSADYAFFQEMQLQ